MLLLWKANRAVERTVVTTRATTGEYAHDSCIEKAKSGQSADQPSLGELGVQSNAEPKGVFKAMNLGKVRLPIFEELMDDGSEPIHTSGDRKSLDDLLGGGEK